MSYQAPNPREIAERGSEIYDRKYRDEYERKWRGRFAAIDITNERAFVADFPEGALGEAKKASPRGVFFLVRIGSPAAFRTSRLVGHADPRGV